MFIFLGSCTVPRDIPTPDTFHTTVKGSKIYLYPKASQGKKAVGEIIAIQDSLIYVLESEIKLVNNNYVLVHQTKIVDLRIVKEGYIVLSRLATSEFKNADWIGALVLTHGWFSPITMLFNWGSIRSVKKATYRMRIGKDIYWNDVHKFARFPQGLPPDLKLGDIR